MCEIEVEKGIHNHREILFLCVREEETGKVCVYGCVGEKRDIVCVFVCEREEHNVTKIT